jgi:hypothetical protein
LTGSLMLSERGGLVLAVAASAGVAAESAAAATILWIYVETRYVVITREMTFPSYSAPVSSCIH